MNGTNYKQSPHYSNILLLSRDGEPLSTISEKRYKWYLKKKLAIEVESPSIEGHTFEHAIQLTFEHNSFDDDSHHHITVSHNQCVICGKNEELSLHHVIPYVIRRHFPDKDKEHSREWCVLLCIECHNIVEELTQPIYKKNFPETNEYKNYNISLQQLKHEGKIERVKPERLEKMLAQSDYKTIENIPPYLPENRIAFHKSLSNVMQSAIEVWANKFIEEKGGVEGVKSYFRDMFMSLQPKSLPKGYLEIKDET
jgi:hypothetical protein